ncbi:MAG: hypothetical protein Ct9H90mP2_11000 [Dehalococcoidia bacterium]|nr:MAG: hypothetical protein Ct9H90mP2_11000 [Dehalococcoidia bacterium]
MINVQPFDQPKVESTKIKGLVYIRKLNDKKGKIFYENSLKELYPNF